MSDFEDEPFNIGGPPRKIKKIQHRAQKFRKEWCSYAEFKDWLIAMKMTFSKLNAVSVNRQ